MKALQEAARHMSKVDAIVGPARALALDTTIAADARGLLFQLVVIEIALLANCLPLAPSTAAAAEAQHGGVH